MERINIISLDDLIAIYFVQDYDLFDDSNDIEPKIDASLSASHKGMQHAVILDIDLLLAECDDIKADFRAHYQRTFIPENRGTTPAKFLRLVTTRISLALQGQQKEISMPVHS
ncbi:contact-dependent growth inhibition system immunity protein [Brenneria tiliae]|uniref:contact-dependent growth inhibition system immunity protein n=1 Tax=Brenneria tiliae TaxID=2914984 RepID=UPI0020148C11|nr:contact-dependent growth inhibition system immunity protein [Brenneria tiliae]MCL2897164.1 contact-dependent growth inhibition system immunity protein [Brenneria tiliae]MCL2904817.1 contact-dependent growth inhibition system immunity protein [Brenneria tiliae]